MLQKIDLIQIETEHGTAETTSVRFLGKFPGLLQAIDVEVRVYEVLVRHCVGNGGERLLTFSKGLVVVA